MPNQRAINKRMIGAQASDELRAAIDEWLRRNPGHSQTDYMPNQRAINKRMIGAQASDELRAAIDEWLRRNPGHSQTDFLLAALIEKLQCEGIPIDPVLALQDRRIRLLAALIEKLQCEGIPIDPVLALQDRRIRVPPPTDPRYPSTASGSLALNEPVSSKPPSDAAALAALAARRRWRKKNS